MIDRVPGAAVLANALAATALVAASLLAQRQDRLADQLGWLTLACVALMLALVADVGIVLQGRRRLADRRALLRPTGGQGTRLLPAADEALVSASGQQHFHRTGCLLVASRPTQEDSQVGHERAGRRPCGACRP